LRAALFGLHPNRAVERLGSDQFFDECQSKFILRREFIVSHPSHGAIFVLPVHIHLAKFHGEIGRLAPPSGKPNLTLKRLYASPLMDAAAGIGARRATHVSLFFIIGRSFFALAKQPARSASRNISSPLQAVPSAKSGGVASATIASMFVVTAEFCMVNQLNSALYEFCMLSNSRVIFSSISGLLILLMPSISARLSSSASLLL
jgi:hypothetical protein